MLAVCLFDGLCERLMGLSSVSGSRILLAVFVCVCVSFSGCLCVCHSRCGCVVCVVLCVGVFCVLKDGLWLDNTVRDLQSGVISSGCKAKAKDRSRTQAEIP